MQIADGVRKSRASNPGHGPGHILLGRALSALRRHHEALASFEWVIPIAPDLAPAHAHCGDLLRKLGIDRSDRALALAPHWVEDGFSRGVALAAAGPYDDAILSFDCANRRYAHLRRAKVLLDLQRHDEALESVDRALP